MKPTNIVRIVLSLAWKDLQVIFKDRGLLVIIIGLPMVIAMLNGVVNQRMSQSGSEGLTFPVIVVNEDDGTYGTQMVEVLKGISVLKVTELESVAVAEQQVRDSKALAAILIPPSLTKNLAAYQPSEIQVMIDPTQQQIARIIPGIMNEVVGPFVVQGEVSHAIQTVLSEAPGYQQLSETARQGLVSQNVAVQMSQVQKMITDPWIKVDMRTQTGQEMVTIPSNLFVLFVPSFTVMFAFFIVGAMASELLQEKQQGSMRRLLAAPIAPWTIIAGKMLAYIGLVVVQVILIFAVANLAFDMPLGRSLAGLLAVTLAMGLASTGLGMVVAALARTDRQADSIGILLGFVLGALGGCFVIGSPVPLYKSGGLIETIARLTPQAHALEGFDKLLNQGAGLASVLPQVGILCLFAFVFFLVAVWRFKYE